MGIFRRFFTSGKGALHIEVTDRLYSLGEEINGILTLEAKRDLGPGRLFVALVCIEEVTRWTNNSQGQRSQQTDRREMFRYETDLGVDEAFSSGTVERRPFTLRLPLPDTGKAPYDKVPEWAHGVMAVADALSRNERKVWWDVLGRYHIDGIDLADEQRLSVNNYDLL